MTSLSPSISLPRLGSMPVDSMPVSSTSVGSTPAVSLHDAIQKQVADLQAELDSAKAEVNVLRRRDETLKFSMTRLDQELRLAARLQQDFLPRTLPQVGAIHFHTLFRPAGYVSGDLYDAMRLDETHVGVFICDAVGHGMPAALLTMFIKRALQTKEIFTGGYRLLGPEQTMSRLNDALVEQNLSEATFATALYGVIDTATLDVSFCCGGHPAPLLMRDGQLSTVEGQGTLLGIFPDEQFIPSTIRLRSGDRFIMYSDGVEVAFQSDLDSNGAQWRRELGSRAGLTAEEMLSDFAGALDRELGSLSPKDDLTMIVLEVK
jgi:serine phosphatase RsbU (regulator of sigma subunit)